MQKTYKENRLIYRGLAGSQMYGTAIEESDEDYIEVYTPYLSQIFGLSDKFKGYTHKVTDDEDAQRFNVNKFMMLILKGNPNALETLFAPAHQVKKCTTEFYHLTKNIKEVLNRRLIYKSHVGFAKHQLAKMCVQNKKAGERRRKLIAEYGYDVKYAAHAVRLVAQCRELLSSGRIQFPYSSQRVFLLKSIRNGKYNLQEVQNIFDNMMQKLDRFYLEEDSVITDGDKTPLVNSRLHEFYRMLGYAK